MKLPTRATQGPIRGSPRTAGSVFDVDFLQVLQALGGERSAIDVGDDAAEVAKLALFVKQARLFFTRLAVSH